MFLEKIKNNYKTLMIVAGINVLVFAIVNLIFDIKYEQVDDFIIYNLYSGLDGTYNIHGVYIHPVLCFILGMFFRILPMVNWHTMFLLVMQFICFTIIGTLLIKKNNSKISYILYILFVSVCYTSMLQLIQYTSVAALLILTAFFVMMDYIEQEKQRKKYIICYAIVYTLGIMTRMQSLMIIAPFFALYFVYNLVLFIRKKVEKEKIIRIVKNYLLFVILTVAIYVSNYIFYNNEIYKNYDEFNELRTILHDNIYVSYEENKTLTKRLADICKDADVSSVAALGEVRRFFPQAMKYSGPYQDDFTVPPEIMTDPEQAREFVEYTGVDTLAISIGQYVRSLWDGELPPFKKYARLDFERLEKIREKTSAHLILHGATHVREEDLSEAAGKGISMIKVASEQALIWSNEIRNFVTGHPDVMFPEDIQKPALAAVKESMRNYIRLFHANGQIK